MLPLEKNIILTQYILERVRIVYHLITKIFGMTEHVGIHYGDLVSPDSLAVCKPFIGKSCLNTLLFFAR